MSDGKPPDRARNLLDVGDLAGDLDDLVRSAGSATRAGGLLTRAGPLAARLLAAPAAGDIEQPAGRWCAVRTRFGRSEDVVCDRGGAGAVARVWTGWDDGVLMSVHVQVGDRLWGEGRTPRGAFALDADESVADPAEQTPAEDRSIRQELLRWEREKADAEWTCERCSWVNKNADQACVFCGIAGDPWSSGPQVVVFSAAPRGRTLSLPPGDEEFLDRLLAEVGGPARRARHARRPGRTTEAGDVVLQGFEPDVRDAVVQAVRDVLELLGQPVDPARAGELVDGAPTALCCAVPPERADAVLRLLRRAGAAAEFRQQE